MAAGQGAGSPVIQTCKDSSMAFTLFAAVCSVHVSCTHQILGENPFQEVKVSTRETHNLI